MVIGRLASKTMILRIVVGFLKLPAYFLECSQNVRVTSQKETNFVKKARTVNKKR